MMQRTTFPLLVVASVLLAGCRPTQPQGGGGYYGPTQTMAQVVEDINRNNAKIPTLWASHVYEANIYDEHKNKHFVSGRGVLLYSRPTSMRLIGTKEIVGTIFEIGSNPETFWLKLGPDAGDTMWWGTYADLAHVNPDRIGIPIRPDLVLDVLGISTINTNFNELPVPTMRFNNDFRVYMFVWNAKMPDRWVAQREVWYDMNTKLPKYVFLFDTNGRVVLRGTLSQYRQVPVPNVPKEQWPTVPGNYVLFFPETQSQIVFTLDEVALSRKQEGPTGREVTVPNPQSFRMPSPDNAGVSRVNRIGPENSGG
ncbi:MAG: hypothetical protein JWP03_1226 [Phycisphaerales bacterium]|jgi:hypothetical protein|nr:hypothetical protein [Phycisphaerales bacterium]